MTSNSNPNKIIYLNNEPYMNYTIKFNNGNFSCFAPGLQVYTETWFECGCYQFAFILEKIGFGYITALLCTIIIVISLFGGIKENYKWFIFNQAIWDLLVSYDVICSKPTNRLYAIFFDLDFKKEAWNQGSPTCFYSTIETANNAVYSWTLVLNQIATGTLENIQYSMTFSLAFSRFLAMFFTIFYEKHTEKGKLFKILVCYNLATIFLLNLHHICDYFIKHQIIGECYCETCNITATYATKCVTIIQDRWWRYVINGIRYAAMSIWLLLASIFTYAVLIKILLHIKFQYKTKQKTLSSTLRICFALFFTAFVFSLYFLYIFLQEFMGNWIRSTLVNAGVDPKITKWFLQAVPPWLLHFNNTKQSLNNLRIFIECMLALIVLTGYREGLIKIIKKLTFISLHPKKALNNADNSTVVVPYAA